MQSRWRRPGCDPGRPLRRPPEATGRQLASHADPIRIAPPLPLERSPGALPRPNRTALANGLASIEVPSCHVMAGPLAPKSGALNAIEDSTRARVSGHDRRPRSRPVARNRSALPCPRRTSGLPQGVVPSSGPRRPRCLRRGDRSDRRPPGVRRGGCRACDSSPAYNDALPGRCPVLSIARGNGTAQGSGRQMPMYVRRQGESMLVPPAQATRTHGGCPAFGSATQWSPKIIVEKQLFRTLAVLRAEMREMIASLAVRMIS